MNAATFSKLVGILAIVLTIAFVTLRLTNIIAWSWVWVLAPIWGTVALATCASALLFWVIVQVLAAGWPYK